MSALREGRNGIDRGLRWGLIITIVFSVAALVGGTMSTYRATPPIPDHVIAPDGAELFTKADISPGEPSSNVPT